MDTSDDFNDDPPQDVPTRRLPPLTFCEVCGRRPFRWTCSCGLHLCDAHRSCFECGVQR